MLYLPIQSLDASKEESRWAAFFQRIWPAYRKWFLKEGPRQRPGYLTSSKTFEKYFPELVQIYNRLCQWAGGEDLSSRFLSMYCPPPYMSGCSQLAWTRDVPLLIRNYDYSPRFFEGTLLRTHWLKPVMGMSDCAWGLLDGINADGLCVSLTFGGRKITAPGFGIPLVLRYCLETCTSVEDAVNRLLPIPVHMAYNVTLLDKQGNYATIYFIPGAENQVIRTPIGTNHQEEVNWPDYALMTRTVERRNVLDEVLVNPLESANSVVQKFLEPPLFNSAYEKAFGTLYTAVYVPLELKCSLLWPGKSLVQSLSTFHESKNYISLKGTAGRMLAQ